MVCFKVFKNGPSEICGRQPLRNFTWSILEYFDPNVTLCENFAYVPNEWFLNELNECSLKIYEYLLHAKWRCSQNPVKHLRWCFLENS